MSESQRMVSGKLGEKYLPVCLSKTTTHRPKKLEQKFPTLSVELDSIIERKWNSERVIVFQSVILQHVQAVNNGKHIGTYIQF